MSIEKRYVMFRSGETFAALGVSSIDCGRDKQSDHPFWAAEEKVA
jgi:hypothetical protein